MGGKKNVKILNAITKLTPTENKSGRKETYTPMESESGRKETQVTAFVTLSKHVSTLMTMRDYEAYLTRKLQCQSDCLCDRESVTTHMNL